MGFTCIEYPEISQELYKCKKKGKIRSNFAVPMLDLIGIVQETEKKVRVRKRNKSYWY